MSSLSTSPTASLASRTEPPHGPLTVAYVIMEFPSETFAATDLLALRRAGVNVTVHAMRVAPPDAVRRAEEQGVASIPATHNGWRASLAGVAEVVRHPRRSARLLAWLVRHMAGRPTQLARSLVLAPRAVELVARLRRERPDVVHLFWGHYPAIVGWLVEDEMPDVPVSVFLGAYDLHMRYAASGPVARRADAVWTHAAVNVADIARLGVPMERIHLAYRGVDMARFPPDGTLARKVPKRIVTAGRLIPSKAMDDVLRTFQVVLERHPTASLGIVGDGPERERLVRLARALGVDHAVEFHGQLSPEAVIDEMARAEVFLFLSKKDSERLPNVVKEAMGTRCLCIASDTPGVDELIEDGRHGAIVARDDVGAAAAAVDRAFSDDAWRRRLVAQAYERLSEDFDVDRVMKRYRRVWTDLREERRERRAPS